ncbi:putative glucosylceramidase 3 [Blattella germanica]|nr:putative glucosylceramidase 3 [Blattella germanica]
MQNVYPDLFLLNTEASVTWGPAAPQPSWINRSWENLEDYVTIMLKALNNCVQGWMDWNLFLDKEGGPNMFPIPVDAPIKIISPNKFYKQDMWYGLAHFSHFIPQGSKRTDLKPWNNNTKSLTSIAFLTPENRVAIILLNRDNNPQDIVINVSKEDQIRLTLSSRSLHTFIYKA